MTTYEDALKYLKDKNSYTEHLSSYVGVHWGEVYDIAIEAIEKQIKYRWHDLRKNPEDLPRQDGLYSVAVEYETDIVEVGFGYYENMYGYTSGWSSIVPSVGQVIAWRYIEPWEEEKDDQD